MATTNDSLDIIRAHRMHPSRAAANVLAEHYVLNGAPPAVVRAGIEALCHIPCREAVEALAALRVGRGRQIIALTAIDASRELLQIAIEHGYMLLTLDEVPPLTESAAVRALEVDTATSRSIRSARRSRTCVVRADCRSSASGRTCRRWSGCTRVTTSRF
jgi:hypothetical protein